MESKFIPVRGNPSSPTKNTNYPFWVIGIFLCVEDGVEVYPRQGKSIFPHQNRQVSKEPCRFYFFTLLPFETCRFRESVIVNTHRKRILQRHRNARQMHGAEKNLARLRQHREEKPHMTCLPVHTVGGFFFYPLPLPVHTAAAPAPGATGRPPARQNSRRTPSAHHAHTAIDTPPPTPAAAQSTPHIAASASPLSGCEFFIRLNNFCLRLYSIG